MAPVWRERGTSLRVTTVAVGAIAGVQWLAFATVGWAAAQGTIDLAALAVFVSAINGMDMLAGLSGEALQLAHGASSVPAVLALERRLASDAPGVGTGTGAPAPLPLGSPRTSDATAPSPPRVRHADQVRPAEPAESVGPFRVGLRLEGVRFRYPGRGTPVLREVDLFIPPGRSLAVGGENGAGKTTLVKLLARLYEPDAGQILVDGVDLRRFPLARWRARVSAAFQDFCQFEFIVREAVGIGDLPRITDGSAVAGALARAGAAELVQALPSGLETQLGKRWDGGTDLSGGQWQRLALGRAAMRDEPLLVILDEPTAALDAQAEHALFERFAAAARSGAARGTVTVLVSHRFSAVRMADLILVLAGGRVVEYGSHHELMQQGGTYAELYALQAAAYQ
jgi:ABC-type multidrug transport system fused ATPase/permease subunit